MIKITHDYLRENKIVYLFLFGYKFVWINGKYSGRYKLR